MLTELPLPTGALGGAVYWYSIIHTRSEDLEEVFAEVARVLRSDGHVLLAFQSGNGERVHRRDAYGTGLPLSNYRHSADEVVRALADGGLAVHARAEREPTLEHESSPQTFILAGRTRGDLSGFARGRAERPARALRNPNEVQISIERVWRDPPKNRQ